MQSPLARKIQTEKPRLLQAGSGRGSLAPTEAREVVNTRRPPLSGAAGAARECQPLTRGRRPRPRAWRTWVTGGHPGPGATALQQLPTSKAQAPLQTVYVAPRTRSFESSPVIRLAGSLLPRAHVACDIKQGPPQGHPLGQHASSEWGRRASDSSSRLSPPTSEAKKDPHPDL